MAKIAFVNCSFSNFSSFRPDFRRLESTSTITTTRFSLIYQLHITPGIQEQKTSSRFRLHRPEVQKKQTRKRHSPPSRRETPSTTTTINPKQDVPPHNLHSPIHHPRESRLPGPLQIHQPSRNRRTRLRLHRRPHRRRHKRASQHPRLPHAGADPHAQRQRYSGVPLRSEPAERTEFGVAVFEGKGKVGGCW